MSGLGGVTPSCYAHRAADRRIARPARRRRRLRRDRGRYRGRVIERSEQGADPPRPPTDRRSGDQRIPAARRPPGAPVDGPRPPPGTPPPHRRLRRPPPPPGVGPERGRAGPRSDGRHGSLGASSPPAPHRRPGSPAWMWLLFAALGFLGGQVAGRDRRRDGRRREREPALAHRHHQAERAAHLVHRVDPARAVGRLLRRGLARQPGPGHPQPGPRPRPAVPLDRPGRGPDRGRRPDPGGADVRAHRPARPQLQPAVQRPEPAADRGLARSGLRWSSPSAPWSAHRSSRSCSSGACCCAPWPGCSATSADGWARRWPSS